MPRMTVDQHLFERLHDLAETLPEDVGLLPSSTMPADGLRDLGERLEELGRDLVSYANGLDHLAAQRLPADGWIPEAGAASREERHAHYVGRGRLRIGMFYIATCGAACFPFYGRDTEGKIAGHERCGTCVTKGAA